MGGKAVSAKSLIKMYLVIVGEAHKDSNPSRDLPPSSRNAATLTRGWFRGTCNQYVTFICHLLIAAQREGSLARK